VPESLCSLQTKDQGLAVLAIHWRESVSTLQFLETLQKRISTIADNGDIKGFIVTGLGRMNYSCPEADNSTLYDLSALSGFGQQVMFNLEKTGKPCIAVIDGECTGLGLEIALSCDFMVASESAAFGFPAIADGVIPFCGGTQRLARLVGKSKAKEMIYSGELINSGEGLRIKLINRLYSDPELLPKTMDLMTHICSRSPNAIRVGGEVINAGFDIDLNTACMLERNAFALCFSSFDQHEGMQAFLDKRPPQFKGE
jgi:enoyl-CoA hydratase